MAICHCSIKIISRRKASQQLQRQLTAAQKTLNGRYLALKDEVKEAGQIRRSVYDIFTARGTGAATQGQGGGEIISKEKKISVG